MIGQIDIELIRQALRACPGTFISDTTAGERVQIELLCDIAQSLRRIAHIFEEKNRG